MKHKKTVALFILIITALLLQSCSLGLTESANLNPNNLPRPIYNNTYSFKKADTLDAIYDVYTQFYFDYYPEEMDFIGDVSGYGFENPKLYFPEYSTEAEVILKDVNTRAVKALESVEVEPYSNDFYDKEVLIWYCTDTLNKLNYPTERYFAYQNFGAQSLIPTLLLDMHEISTVNDAEAYIERIKDAGRFLNDIYDQVEIGKSSDVMIPKSSAMNLFSELKSELKGIDKYKEKLIKALDELEIEATQYEALLLSYDDAQENALKPALNKLIEQSTVLFKSSLYSNGLSELPRGKEYYEAHIIPHHLGLDLTAEEIHTIGLNEVKRIKEELAILIQSMGYEGDLKESIDDIKQYSKRFHGEDAFAEYERIMAEIHKQLPLAFHEGNIPKKNPAIRFYDYNSYFSATVDGNRDAYFNIVDAAHASYAITALAIHEASPGHHLQISNVLDDPDARLLRKLLGTTSYIEGWALYSEKVALESGFVKSDDVKVGLLLSELFRAGRLVVDTGLHYYDWTKMEAETYLRDEAFFDYPEFEVNRYMTMPGQALAYKMGELKILELRQLAMDSLGSDFDLKEFHAVILDDGFLPLRLLENKVLGYIESNQ